MTFTAWIGPPSCKSLLLAVRLAIRPRGSPFLEKDECADSSVSIVPLCCRISRGWATSLAIGRLKDKTHQESSKHNMATTSSWHLIEAHKHGGAFLFISHILSRHQSVAWIFFDLLRVYISLSMGYLCPWSCTNSWAVPCRWPLQFYNFWPLRSCISHVRLLGSLVADEQLWFYIPNGPPDLRGLQAG